MRTKLRLKTGTKRAAASFTRTHLRASEASQESIKRQSSVVKQASSASQARAMPCKSTLCPAAVGLSAYRPTAATEADMHSASHAGPDAPDRALLAGRLGRSVGNRHTNRRSSSSLGIDLALLGRVLAWRRHRSRCCLLSFVFHEIDGLRQAIRRDVVLVPQLVVYYTQIALRQSVLLRCVPARMRVGKRASERACVHSCSSVRIC
jgi:hypothetical protein